jgi:hypothetical protein
MQQWLVHALPVRGAYVQWVRLACLAAKVKQRPHAPSVLLANLQIKIPCAQQGNLSTTVGLTAVTSILTRMVLPSHTAVIPANLMLTNLAHLVVLLMATAWNTPAMPAPVARGVKQQQHTAASHVQQENMLAIP